MSLLMFIVENLVPIPNIPVHRIILITSSTSVLLSLLEMYVITKEYWYYLLISSITRLGPLVTLAALGIFFSNRYDSHLLVGSICLTFQAIKGICLLIASVSNINQKVKEKKRRIKHHYQKPTSMEKDVRCITSDKKEVLIVPTICLQRTSDETPKKVLAPMEPAYNFSDGLV